MATITVKDIPDDLCTALKEIAAATHRSISREIIYYIEQAVHNRGRNIEEILADARRVQEKIGNLAINEETLTEAKNMGRS